MNVCVVSEEETLTKKIEESSAASLSSPDLTGQAPVSDSFEHSAEPATQRLSAEACLECISALGFKFTVQPNATIGRKGIINVKTIPNSQYISRIHATFLHEAGLWYIRDENSTEGTCVNGIKIIPGIKQPLKNGDQITLAIMTFTFRSQ